MQHVRGIADVGNRERAQPLEVPFALHSKGWHFTQSEKVSKHLCWVPERRERVNNGYF